MECLLPFRIKAAIDGRPVLTRQRLLAATAKLCNIRAASAPENDESSWSGTDHCTSPICSAVLPSTMSQPRTMRFAVAIPHNLASRCAPSAPGIRPNARLRQSEQGAMARHRQIAGQSKLKASAEGRARNFRQRHDRQRLNGVEYVLHSFHMGHKLLASSRTGEEGPHHLEVCTGAKHLLRAAQVQDRAARAGNLIEHAVPGIDKFGVEGSCYPYRP